MNVHMYITINQNLRMITMIFLLLFIIQCFCSSESNIITIDVHKANHFLRDRNFHYLDVRTREEFMDGHVDFSDTLNIPYMLNTPQGRVKNNNFIEQVLRLCNKDDHLVVGCQSGVRSLHATKVLHKAGFKHVYNMEGGYLAWVENALPVMAVLTSKVQEL